MEQLRIDLVPMGVTPNAHASQFDVGRVIRFLLYNGGTAYTLAGTETITVKMAKPDGTEETVSVTNTSSNYVDFITTDGLLNQAGLYPCEISITSGTDVIGSKNFNLRVELDPYDGHNIRRVTVGPADICTFDTTLPEPYQSVTVNVEATGGNGTPDNPIPINGYTEANITRCGVNLWDEEWEVGGINGSTGANGTSINQIRSINKIPVKPNTQYYFKLGNLSNQGNIFSYGIDKAYLGIDTLMSNISGTVITTGAETYYIRISSGSTYGTTYNNDISINYPATDTTYHAYNGQTYTIAFGQTVYGGVLDVTRGKLTVTHIVALFDGTEVYSYYFPTIVCEKKFTKGSGTPVDMICSHAPTVSLPNQWFGYANATNEKFEFRKVGDNWGCADVDAFKTFIATQYANGTPVQIRYPLNTPFDIDLTGVQIRALVGENNVFADCGETEVEYLTEGT